MRILSFFTFLIFLSVCFAQNDVLEYVEPSENPDFDESLVQQWKEDYLNKLPELDEGNLVEISLDSPPIGFKLYIDENSLAVSETDYIIRYWLIFKAGKSRNASFDGLRCSTREYKTYAYENKWDKTKLKLNPIAKWEQIDSSGHNQYREELRRFYFCNDVIPRSKVDIIQRLKGYIPVNKHDDYLN